VVGLREAYGDISHFAIGTLISNNYFKAKMASDTIGSKSLLQIFKYVTLLGKTYCCKISYKNKNKLRGLFPASERYRPTERPLLVGEVSAKFSR
jgi:hypothetical protein